MKINKLSKINKGFTLLEVLLVVLAVAIIGTASYIALNHINKKAVTTNSTTSKSSTTTISAVTTTCNGTATLEYEKITYLCPSGWTMTNLYPEPPVTKSQAGCVYPGFDDIVLTSPTNETIGLITGKDCVGDGGSTPFESMPINSLGENIYLVLEGVGPNGAKATSPGFACLAQSSTPKSPLDFTSKNIFYAGLGSSQPLNSFCYYPNNVNSSSTPPTQTASSIEDSVDFSTAKSVFESMHY